MNTHLAAHKVLSTHGLPVKAIDDVIVKVSRVLVGPRVAVCRPIVSVHEYGQVSADILGNVTPFCVNSVWGLVCGCNAAPRGENI